MVNDLEQIRGLRIKTKPIDDFLVDYEELYDELFSRMEQGIGAQIRPIPENKDDGGDE